MAVSKKEIGECPIDAALSVIDLALPASVDTKAKRSRRSATRSPMMSVSRDGFLSSRSYGRRWQGPQARRAQICQLKHASESDASWRALLR